MAICYVLTNQVTKTVPAFDLEVGQPLVPQLLRRFPRGFPGVTIGVYNAQQKLEMGEALEWVVSDDDRINMRLSPNATGVVAYVSIAALAITAAAAVAGFFNIETPDPNTQVSDTPSGTNLSVQRNRARPGGRIPEVFGRVLQYPDLLSPGYDTYWNNRQTTHELFCLGMGRIEFNFAEPLTPGGPDFGKGARLGEQELLAEFAQTMWLRPDLTRNVAAPVPYEQEVIDYNINEDSGELGAYAPFVTGDQKAPLVIMFRNAAVGREELIAPDEAGQAPGDEDLGFEFVGGPVVGYFYANPRVIAAFPDPLGGHRFVRFSGNSINVGIWQILQRVIGEDKDSSYLQLGVGASMNSGSGTTFTAQVTSGAPIRQFVSSDTFFGPAGGGTIRIYDQRNSSRSAFVGRVLEVTGTENREWNSRFGEGEPPLVIQQYQQGPNDDTGRDDIFTVSRISGTSTGWTLGRSSATLTYYQFNETLNENSVDLGQPSDNWISFDVPSEDPDEVWFDIDHPSGLYLQEPESKGLSTISNTFMVEIVPSDERYTTDKETITFVAATRDRLRRTYRRQPTAKAEKGSTDLPIKYRIRIRRVTQKGGSLRDQEGQYQDDAYLVRVAGAKQWSNYVHPDPVTMFYLTLNSSTFDIPNSSDRRLNIDTTRWLPRMIYCSAIGETDFGSTQRVCDALMHTATDPTQGNWDESEVDTDALLSIQNTLDSWDTDSGSWDFACGPVANGRQGRFNYIFDRRISVEEQLKTIANVAKIHPYKVGAMLSFALDEYQKPVSGLFNRKNKSPAIESRTFSFATPEDYDGVELDWVDPDANWIKRTYRVPENTAIFNPKKVTLTGCTNWPQAYRRAWYEWNVLRYRRDSMEIEVTEEGRFLVPYDRIRIADNVLSQVADGEVIATASLGNNYFRITVDRPMTSVASSGQYMTIRDITGQEMTYCGVVGTVANYVDVFKFSGENPTDLTLPESTDQVRLLFTIAQESDITSKDEFLVSQVSAQNNGYTRIGAANFAFECYQDEAPYTVAPARPAYDPYKNS